MGDELASRTTRDGVFNQLMRIYDKEASNNYSKIFNPEVKKSTETFSDFMKKTPKRATVPMLEGGSQK